MAILSPIDRQHQVRTVGSRIQVVPGPGGIEAWLVEDHSLPLVSVTFGFQGGAALDADGKAGTARLMASLLNEGAGALSGEAFQLALAEDAIEIGFSIERDRLCGSVTTLADKVSDAFALLGVALREPHFAPEEIDRRRDAFRARLLSQQNQPDHVAEDSFLSRGFRGHPYARPYGGRLADIDEIGREDILVLHRDLIVCARLRIAVVGAIEAEALATVLDNTFRDLPVGVNKAIDPTALQGLGDEINHIVDSPQTSIFFGRPAISVHDPDFSAAVLFNHCLGGHGITSRLAQELREKRGLCYGVESSLAISQGAASLLIRTSTPNEHVSQAVRLVRAEMQRIVQDGLDAEEIDAARNYLIGSQAMEMDTSRFTARTLLSMQFNEHPPSWLDKRKDRLVAVTQLDMARTIERVVGNGSMLLALAGGSA